MATAAPTVWGIHAGNTGDAHTLVCKHNALARLPLRRVFVPEPLEDSE
jgi:hypothetical protein